MVAVGGLPIAHSAIETDGREAQAARAIQPIYGVGVPHIPSDAAITKKDVVDWTQRGVRDDVIIDRIEHTGIRFKLTATDQNNLRDAGVSEEVIRTMRDSARR